MCPKCSSQKIQTYDSRKRETQGGSIWRKRLCKKCFNDWVTIEVNKEHYESLDGKIINNVNLDKAVTKLEKSILSNLGKFKEFIKKI